MTQKPIILTTFGAEFWSVGSLWCHKASKKTYTNYKATCQNYDSES